MRKFIFAMVAALLLIPVAVPVGAADSVAHVRVAHFSADTPPVDVFVNGVPSKIKGLAYKSVTDWMDMTPGEYTLSALPKGGIRSGIFDLKADEWLTVAAVGSMKDNSLKLVGIDEDHSSIGKGRARVILFHGIADEPAVDVRSGDFVVAPKLAFPGTQGTNKNNDGVFTANEKAGTYDFQIVATGTKKPVILDAPSTELKENMIYLVAAIGTKDKPEIDVLSQSPS